MGPKTYKAINVTVLQQHKIDSKVSKIDIKTLTGRGDLIFSGKCKIEQQVLNK
jgi:hypothetical protein